MEAGHSREIMVNIWQDAITVSMALNIIMSSFTPRIPEKNTFLLLYGILIIVNDLIIVLSYFLCLSKLYLKQTVTGGVK
jgi:hypothetical protein